MKKIFINTKPIVASIKERSFVDGVVQTTANAVLTWEEGTQWVLASGNSHNKDGFVVARVLGKSWTASMPVTEFQESFDRAMTDNNR